MNVNLLAFNVGNSRTQVGLFIDGELTRTEWIENGVVSERGPLVDEMFEQIASTPDGEVYVSSVNGPAAQDVTQLIARTLGREPVRAERDVNVPIGRQLDPETMVGEDRLLNAAAAYDRIQQACIVADLGTAVSVDFIDGDGTFHGGAIFPGGRMMLDALHHGGDQLPAVGLGSPEEPIGHSTEQAMLNGVYHSIRGGVRELAEQYALHYGAYPKIVATGGDAPLLLEGYELVEVVVPELTLLGLAVTRHYALNPAE